jgi:hypothetical protein
LFDTQTTNTIPRKMAGSFYNVGDIRCNSVIDTDTNFFFLFTIGKFNAWATNIVNPGTVSVGFDGLLQFTGQNVDLTRSQLTVENSTDLNFFFNTVAMNVLAASVGGQTNVITPAANFSLPNPYSGIFGNNFNFTSLNLQNATAYVNDSGVIGTTRFVRAVFISNPVPSVTNNVYFTFGDNIIEWAGTYVDPATGLSNTNYMYLEDSFGEITNLQVNFNGGPVGYFWVQGGPFFLGAPAPSGLPFGTFNNNSITNAYAYESVQFIPTSVATNAGGTNPTGALTNLPGRIQITATHNLDLSLANIQGANYMSLMATNQFDGSSGATIFSPFSDISLGATNGFLSISNLLEPSVPNWNGPVQVFTARWQELDAFGITNVYHVTLVNSLALPTTPPLVQNLTLHATNTTSISDIFNIIGKLSIDAKSLTLTTNLNTDGTGSQAGELNLQNNAIIFSNSIPNLRCLTNNGAIRTGNLLVFGAPANGLAFINNGLVSDQGLQAYALNFVSSGAISNGVGSFAVQSLTTTLTNGVVTAGGDFSITANTLVASNVMIQASRSLTLTVTNRLTDTGVTNGNVWVVGATSIGVGLNLPLKPVFGDLLGTTITNFAPLRKNVVNTWAGQDRGATTAGYVDNMAVGRLILDAQGSAPQTQFTFQGAGGGNAIYVDYLELRDSATNFDGTGNVSSLSINTNNMVIYYAEAFINGASVAAKLNHKNGDRLRWVPAYAGHFSSTNIVYPDGTTNTFNTALAKSTLIDSDGDGTPNAGDTTPFFVPSQVALSLTVTNIPPLTALITWHSIPAATNYVYYTTNMMSSTWFSLTNFVSPTNRPPVGGWPITNTVSDLVNLAQPRYYNVKVCPNKVEVYGQ